MTVVAPRWRYQVHRWEITADVVYTRTGWLRRAWQLVPVSHMGHLRLAVGAGGGSYTATDAGFEESIGFVTTVTPELMRPFLESPPEPG